MKRWPTEPLGEVATCLDSQRIPVKEGDRQKRLGSVPYYGANGQVGWINESIFNEPLLLVAEDGGHFDEPERGVAYTVRGPSWVNNHAHALRPDDSKVLLEFLGYQFRHFDFQPYITGTTRAKLTQRDLMRIEVPVPPLGDQERIVKLLDEADELRKLRAQAERRTADLIPALFHEMFGDPSTNPMRWKEATLGDVVHGAKDGPHVSPRYVNSGVPFLSARHIKRGEVVWDDLKYLSRSDAELHWRKCKPERGDILYTKGGTTGIAAAINFDTQIAVWVHIALLKTNHEKVNPSWLESILNSEYCYQQSQQLTHGIANRDLGLTRMIRIQLFIPPLPLQKEFAARVSDIRVMQTEQSASRRRLDELFQSMLHRAFNGEL